MSTVNELTQAAHIEWERAMKMFKMFVMILVGCVVMISNGILAEGQPAEVVNKLTPADVSSGWILLCDGDSDFGWKSTGNAKWHVADGNIVASEGGIGLISTTTEFADFDLQVECWVDAKAADAVLLRGPAAGEVSAASAYMISMSDKFKPWPAGSIFGIAKAKNAPKPIGKWTKLNVRAQGDQLIVIVDGKTTVNVRDTKHNRGVVSLGYGGAGVVKYRNIRLKPLSLKSIFNGKDLTGWKLVEGHKSVFTVTPEGWINVKNGNGDLQTEAVWGDFVMQIEVFSNGDHLNSGVFFRANPGLFWSGYEDQIRNQWEGDNRLKAVDYGTGGVYNRQPARKVVSSDREWFTMTLVAHGFHIGSWVNGIMVADFTDMRPVDETNARNGARSKPGVISLQGHDPTTDLSFRKIGVVEFPLSSSVLK